MAGQPNGSSNVKIQNFLEALRNSQTSRESLENRPGKNIFAEIQAKKEIEKHRIEQFQNHRNQEWNGVYSSKEAQKTRRISEIHQQLEQLVKQVKRLDINLKKAAETPIIDFGEYQETFLENLKTRIHLYTLKVNSANSWLEIYNSRSRKQGMYWSMASSKGSSYTQSNERNIATSVG